MPRRLRAAARLLPLVLVLALALVVGPAGSTAPSSVTLAGDFQSELGCSGDWDPGCTVTDLTGGALNLDSPSLVASNGRIHAAILDVLREVRGGTP